MSRQMSKSRIRAVPLVAATRADDLAMPFERGSATDIASRKFPFRLAFGGDSDSGLVHLRSDNPICTKRVRASRLQPLTNVGVSASSY